MDLLKEIGDRMEAYLRAPAEVKAKMRVSSWQRCTEYLKSLQLRADEAPPPTKPGKFAADIRMGFSPEEARIRQKSRQRAARHHQQLARMEGCTPADMPRSWDHPRPPTLEPGYLARKEAERAQRRAQRTADLRTNPQDSAAAAPADDPSHPQNQDEWRWNRQSYDSHQQWQGSSWAEEQWRNWRSAGYGQEWNQQWHQQNWQPGWKTGGWQQWQ